MDHTIDIKDVLAKHMQWRVSGGSDGGRANLSRADLYGADLSRANLSGANIGATQVIQVGPLGSRNDYLVVTRLPDGSVEAKTGCFRGTLEDLEEAVSETHASSTRYRREYGAAVAYCRAVLV